MVLFLVKKMVICLGLASYILAQNIVTFLAVIFLVVKFLVVILLKLYFPRPSYS